MKIPLRKPRGFASLIAMAVASSFVLTLASCKQPPPSVVKPKPPVSIHVEVQVFSMPRALAAEIVLNQPPGTDYTAVFKSVQALVAEKKATLVATPALTTLSGQRAIVESILEHKYGTEFSPPQIPQTIGGNTGPVVEPQKKVTKTTIITEESGGATPRTPLTPTAFEKRDVGITLEIEPTASENLAEISLQAVLQNVALQGTVKFKSDYNGEIEMPEFFTKKILTNVVLKSGGIAFIGTIEPDKTLTKDEDLTEVVFIRATIR